MQLIFEIGCEELPARFVPPALEQIEEAFKEACDQSRIDAGNVRMAGTPRRLTLLVTDLAETQEDLREERTGPPAAIAYDDAGEPTKAAEGFARGQGVEVDDLYTVETDKGEYLAAEVFDKGSATQTLLPKILTSIIEGLHFPKSMRWGTQDETFGRPVRWILAVAGGEVVPVEFAGVQSSNLTYGHRFSAPDPFVVDSIDSHERGLLRADVIVDPILRRTDVIRALEIHGTEAGGQVVDDPELIDEVIYLIEKTQAVTLHFSEDYLELPREVLISSMRSHQRYFAIEETDGSALRPACVVIYNTPVRDPEVVARGNLKVLRARLDDARFFWEKDLQISLSEHRDKLREVIWIGALGTMYERTERMAGLARDVGAAMELSDDQIESAARAAALSKADLVTQVVNEFPDLQGVMGREYALRSGEDNAVATAIDEQYRPKSADGRLPKTDVGACVAIAEKLDAIVGCFGIDMAPSSASDPYGLRRAALGILRILSDRNSTASLPHLIAKAVDRYEGIFADGEAVARAVSAFLNTRLRYLLTDDAPTDVVNSVLAAGVDDVPSVHGRIEALAALRDEADFEPLALGFKRVVNILEKQAEDVDLDELSVDPSRLEDPAESALYEAYHSAREAVSHHLDERRWDAACESLIELKSSVDQFFDSVMVMADDEALKNNRLALLAELRRLFLEVADISKIRT